MPGHVDGFMGLWPKPGLSGQAGPCTAKEVIFRRFADVVTGRHRVNSASGIPPYEPILHGLAAVGGYVPYASSPQTINYFVWPYILWLKF